MGRSISERLAQLLLFGPNGRSPYTPRRPRHAGQTLEEKLDEHFTLFSFGLLLLVLNVINLLFVHSRPDWINPLLAFESAAGAGMLIWSTPKIATCAKGLSGERETGAVLDKLAREGAYVLHDVPADGFNIDHAVISRAGVFAIETKFMTKRRNASNTLSYRDGALTLRGSPLKNDPLLQATCAAKELNRILKTLGCDAKVRAVALFPGWYIEGRPEESGKPWALEPKAFEKWLAREPVRLSERDAAEMAGLLTRYISSSQ